MADLLDKILPVLTLILGASFTGRQGARTRAALASDRARDMLAEHTERIWDKSDGGWIKLQVYLSTLRGPLRTAGVPLHLVQQVSEQAKGFWRGVRHSGDETVGLALLSNTGVDKELAATVEQIYTILEAQPPGRWQSFVVWARRNQRHDGIA